MRRTFITLPNPPKQYATALGLFLLTLLGCSQESSPPSSQANTAEPAQTPISGLRLDYIDTSVAPGEDFFLFANGQWVSNTVMPADKARYGAFDILRDQAQEDVKAIVQEANASLGGEAQQIHDFYQSFMDTDTLEQRGLEPIQDFLVEIDALESVADIATYFAAANRRGVYSPLSLYIDTDEKDPSQYIVYFYQSGLGLPDRDYYLNDDEKSVANQQAYRRHIGRMFELAGWPSDPALAERLYAMELDMAQAHWPRTELRDRDKTYNKYPVNQLSDLAPSVDWQAYLIAAGLGKSEAVVVSAPSYLQALSNLLTQYSAADWRLYLKWSTLNSYAHLLTADLDREHFHFYSTELRGIEAQQDRWKRAVDTANDLLGDAIGKLYVERHFSPVAKARMEALVENLRTAYHDSIMALEWMGEETKVKAIEKLKKFNPKIGYPNQWEDLSELDIRADDLFGNVLRASEFYHAKEAAKIGSPVNRDEWFMNPQTVNAYYNPGMNEIVFPAAILQPPFFNLEADDAINYGAIGAVIGHEMGHGFDDQGAKSDGDGLLHNWWTEQDFQEFEARTDKLVTQYSGFEALPGLNVNGELTQGENIGDLGGLTIAYKAYQLSLKDGQARVIDGYTGAQRFFLGWGQVWASKMRDEELRRRILTDPHSPPRFRVNGVVPNMPAFYDAFEVTPEQGMYLQEGERVKIW